jgi:hypothetical protein
MPKAQDFIAYAEQCEQLAKRLPEHAQALQDIAAAWRRLAEDADKKASASSENATDAAHPTAPDEEANDQPGRQTS